LREGDLCAAISPGVARRAPVRSKVVPGTAVWMPPSDRFSVDAPHFGWPGGCCGAGCRAVLPDFLSGGAPFFEVVGADGGLSGFFICFFILDCVPVDLQGDKKA
jgi:hypothetical protein